MQKTKKVKVKEGFLISPWAKVFDPKFNTDRNVLKVAVDYPGAVGELYVETTDQLMDRIKLDLATWTIVHYRLEQSKINAIKVDSSYFVLLEADYQHDPDNVPTENIDDLFEQNFNQQDLNALQTYAVNVLGLTTQEIQDIIQTSGVKKKDLFNGVKGKAKSL